MHLRWGSQGNVADPIGETPGSLVQATALVAYLIVWWPIMVVYLSMFLLTGAVTSVMVLASLPFVLCRKAFPERRAHSPSRDSKSPAPPMP